MAQMPKFLHGVLSYFSKNISLKQLCQIIYYCTVISFFLDIWIRKETREKWWLTLSYKEDSWNTEPEKCQHHEGYKTINCLDEQKYFSTHYYSFKKKLAILWIFISFENQVFFLYFRGKKVLCVFIKFIDVTTASTTTETQQHKSF